MTVAKNEYRAVYMVDTRDAERTVASEVEDQVVREALSIIERRMRRASTDAFTSPTEVRAYCRLRLAQLAHEVFMVLFLDAQNRLIAAEEMFRGTLTQTAVYTREVVKAALQHNAASVIFCHNHPSGATEPSQADRWLTDQLRTALSMVDVKTLDHIIVGAGNAALSFAERGLL